MAIELLNKEDVEGASAEFPYGNILDDVPGVTQGTPVNKEVYADFHQFFARMMAISGIVYNGVPDNAYDGFQYFEALENVISKNRSADLQQVFLPGPFQDFDLAYIDITGLTLTTPDDGIERVYDVMVQIDCSRGAGANDIGAYFKVMHGVTDIKEALTRVASGNPHDVCVTFFSGKITIPPNTVVKVQQKVVNGATNEPIIINGELYIRQVG